MEKSKPQDIPKYKEWLKKYYDASDISMSPHYYESVSNKIYMDFRSSRFWASLPSEFEHMEQRYYLDTGYYLFAGQPSFELKIKPFEPFLLKTYRKNVIENASWPNEPQKGWYLPENWYAKVNDVLRTLFVVKYLDGVNYVAERLTKLLAEHGLESNIDYEAKEEGYYAAHLYTKYHCDIPKESWETVKVPITIEMQITTQLQEVIRKLLHKYYEDRRSGLKQIDIKWQWNYKSDEFSANYLGHILHFIEGMIIEIRDRQDGGRK